MIIKRTIAQYLLLILLSAALAACAGKPAVLPSPTPLSVDAPAAVINANSPPAITPTPDLAVTLPVPTPVPPESVAQPTARPTVSALQHVRDDGVLRIGALYNAAPMSSLNDRGEVMGYEADLARAIAADWGVEADFVQVTRQTAVPMLLAGEVDILMASIVHRRDDENLMAFSQTYFAGGQMFLVNGDSPVQDIAGLNGLRVGVVQGTSSERALGRAISTGVLNVTPSLYLTHEQALGALGSGEVDAILAERIQLIALSARAASMRILAEPLEQQPYAIAYRRYDNVLGYLLNRSLQRLYADGTVDALRRDWFPSVTFSLAIPVWEGAAADARTLADFDTALVYPESSLVDHIRAGQGIRVAGLYVDPQLSGLNRVLEDFYQALAQEMAARWQVPVEFIPNSAGNSVDLVAAGQADLAVGVSPGWTGPYEVAYSAPLIVHGDRLMLPVNSQIEGFADLRGGRWVGIFASESGSADRVNALAESVNTAVNIFTIINDEDAVYSLVVDKNVDVVFGDSLRLLPQAVASADLVRLTDRWYSTEYISLAVPRSDPDFRALVDITLQDMAADGTYERLWTENLNIGDPLAFERWPGTGGSFLGVRTGAVR